MTKFIGRLASIGIAKEAVRGTAEASADFYLPQVSLSIDDAVDQAVDESAIGVIEDSPDAAVVAKYAEAEIDGNIYDNSIGLLLLAALGSVSTAGPTETSVYTHTFSVLQSAQHPSLTLFLDDENQDYKYALAALKSLELNILLGQFARYKASFRSKVGATASISPSYTAENFFLPQHGSIKTASSLSGLDGATAIAIRSIKLTTDKNVEDDRKLGSLDQADIINKQFAVTGTLELVFNDNTFKTEMLGDSAKAMRVDLTNSDVTIGTDMHPELTLDFAKVKFSKFERKYSSNDLVTASVEFKAFYSAADTSMVEATLVNTQTSY